MDKIKLNKKRILVTGGNGYLGSHLIAALKKEQADVFVIGRNGISTNRMYKVDITDAIELNRAIHKIQPDIIFHLAASLNRNRNFDKYHEINDVNHRGTLNLLLALKDIPYANFIFISTSEIYGDNEPPFNENQLPLPASPYSLTKLYAENLIATFSRTYNKHYTILRLFNFFGKDMPIKFFIPQLIYSLKNESTFEMTEGEQKRDFLYIDDVIRALVLSAQELHVKNKILNVCSGRAVSLRQLVEKTKSLLKSDCQIKFGAIPYRNNEVWNMVGDNSRINKLLGFKIQYSLEDALKKVLED